MTEPAYSRVLLKLSGEVLAGTQRYGIDVQTLKDLAQEIKEVSNLGVAIALVLGGGRVWIFLRGGLACRMKRRVLFWILHSTMVNRP